MPLDFDRFVNDYFQARPWMLEADGSFKVSSLDMDPDDPAQWRGDTMPSDDQGPNTPAEYFDDGRMWLNLARWEVLENKSPARAGPLAALAMANALLGICAQFIDEQKND